MILVFAFAGLACTSARWTVKERSAIDRDDYRVISSEEFLSISSEVTPESPNLNLQVLSNTTYEFAEKVQVQRTIQDYKLRPGFVALGIVGAGLAAYAANSNTILGTQSPASTLTLNTAAILIAGSGFLNMKPVGEPRQTGEERFLRRTGSLVQQDTLQVSETTDHSAEISIWYGESRLLDRENREIREGELNINLGGILSNLEIQGMETDQVKVEVQYRDSTYQYEYSLDQVLQPFATITSPVAELRSTPEESPENILAELIEDSQLQIVESVDSDWYKILYGISENYIAQDDAVLIWRNSEFSRESEVVAVPIIPFGNIDVENNIPILTGVNSNALGLVVSNENYQKPFFNRSHAHRDARLITAYMENAMGLQAQNVYELRDLSTPDSLSIVLNNIQTIANDSTQIYIYLNGYGSVLQEGENYVLSYEPVDSNAESIKLADLFEKISSLNNDKIIVLADIEFNPLLEEPDISESEIDLKQPLRRISEIITDSNPNATVIFGSQVNQDSELYVSDGGEDKKHHLFPYYFAKALQERRTNIGSIFQYLQRNIPYTSRRIHDRSQDPQIFGNTSQELIPTR